jgi:hypothetical protein
LGLITTFALKKKFPKNFSIYACFSGRLVPYLGGGLEALEGKFDRLRDMRSG